MKKKERERAQSSSSVLFGPPSTINGIQAWPILLRFIPTRCFGEWWRPPTVITHLFAIHTDPHILAKPCAATEPCLLLIISPFMSPFMSLCMHYRTPRGGVFPSSVGPPPHKSSSLLCLDTTFILFTTYIHIHLRTHIHIYTHSSRSSSSMSDDNIRSRKLQPIYNALDARNYKSAVKLCMKKDLEKWDIVKTLKGLC